MTKSIEMRVDVVAMKMIENNDRTNLETLVKHYKDFQEILTDIKNNECLFDIEHVSSEKDYLKMFDIRRKINMLKVMQDFHVLHTFLSIVESELGID